MLPFAPTTKFWAGNRFYRRHDIHVTDFYYWNTSGGGGGIEDVPLGPGRLAFAWIGWGSTSGLSYVPQPDPENRAGFSKSTYDLRAYDLPFLPLAKVTVAPQISIDNRWSSRPVVRAFVTGAFWTDDFIGQVGGVDYAAENEGLNAGVQMEAWW